MVTERWEGWGQFKEEKMNKKEEKILCDKMISASNEIYKNSKPLEGRIPTDKEIEEFVGMLRKTNTMNEIELKAIEKNLKKNPRSNNIFFFDPR